jgi:hypothetical protein
MYGSRSSVVRRIALLLLAGFVMPAALFGQGPDGRDIDLADQARRLDQVAAQKVESELTGALREAERLILSDPPKAAAMLKNALARLEDDAALPEKRRQVWKRMLKDRLRVASASARDVTRETSEQVEKQAKSAAFRAHIGLAPTSQETILQLREGIQRWQKEGGQTPAQSAGERTNSIAGNVAENRQLQAERERRTNAALRTVDKAALLPRSDFDVPKDWRARTQSRKGSNDIPLSAKERAIVRTLDSTLSVSFKNSRFQDVIEYLQTLTGLPIVVHASALEEAGVTYDTPVTLQVKGVAVRSLLRKILADLGLAYVLKEETVQVVTAREARETLVVRVHYIGDLLFGGELARYYQAAQLINLITSTVEPQSWQVNGGPARIYYDDLRKALVIKQSAEVQPVLSGGLR